MLPIYVITGVSLFVGLLNLFAVLFLSNAIFRVLVSGKEPVAPLVRDDRGLVDPKESGTYDPRFSNQKSRPAR